MIKVESRVCLSSGEDLERALKNYSQEFIKTFARSGGLLTYELIETKPALFYWNISEYPNPPEGRAKTNLALSSEAEESLEKRLEEFENRTEIRLARYASKKVEEDYKKIFTQFFEYIKRDPEGEIAKLKKFRQKTN